MSTPHDRRCRGAGAAEYLGLVAAIALVVGGLLAVRPQSGGRTAPVRPIPIVLRLLGEPARLLAEPRAPRVRAAPLAPRVRRRRAPAAPRPRPPTILLPEWLGWRPPGGSR